MPPEWVRPADPAWPAAVPALTTTRDGGPRGGHSRGVYASFNLALHVGDRADAVAANRAWLVDHIGPGRVQWLEQVHGVRVIEASSLTAETVPRADAAWTTERHLALAILTADCVPVVVADRAGTVVGVAHGGWRGLVGGVLAALVSAMPADPAELVAWLGPAIGPSAYQVGEEVVAAVAALPDGAALTSEVCRPAGKPGAHQLNLFALSERLLRRAGVARVSTDRLCTFRDGRFYSYRRDGVTGRMATVAWLDGG
jgi:hypothetical protein